MQRSSLIWSSRWVAFVLIGLFMFQPLLAFAKGQRVQIDAAVVYFSPNGGCTNAIVSEIDQAKSEVLVLAYSFTSKAIAKALARAHERGVKVQIIVDKKQRYARGSVAENEWSSGVPVFVDHYHNAAHNKVMIIDGSIVITGSFNFTRAAEESNAENLLIMRSSSLAQMYISNWIHHKKHSGEYVIRGARASLH